MKSDIVEYITEEVWRQGHDVYAQDGLERVSWMLGAWIEALALKGPLTVDFIRKIGSKIEAKRNKKGFRKQVVYIGTKEGIHYTLIEAKLNKLVSRQAELKPLEFYRAFEDIHPFIDGNGRTGKILLNYLSKTLEHPYFPPIDFWGYPIRNP